ncbi:MAG: EscU/YscU/HrcU family type III secretion system export apparatus switch protein [Planctomycetaceae bacterium]|nr:EscU/YscU/HrcU family type III secretion system export apparatus switch protein [Planctomycetaceae bacterium]
MSEDKTHDPTPYRRQKAREQGQVAKSQDLASAVILLFALVVLMTQGEKLARTFQSYTTKTLGSPIFLAPEIAEDNGLFDLVISQFYFMVWEFLYPLSFFFASLAVVAVVANLVQFGFLWLPEKLFTLDLNRINPISGLKRIFSLQGLMRLLMGILKIIICGVVAFFAVRSEIGTIINLTDKDENQIALYILWTLLIIAVKVASALVIIAVLDYLYQRWKHEQDLKMSSQEVRDEIKQMLGDPKTISKRRGMHRDLVFGQSRESVRGTADADVVVTNPTHYAVALKFDPETMDMPYVVAKGCDFIAKQIRRIALENGIPIVENKPLAQTLYKKVEVGQPVNTREHFRALVSILEYAYRLTGRNLDAAVRKASAKQRR